MVTFSKNHSFPSILARALAIIFSFRGLLGFAQSDSQDSPAPPQAPPPPAELSLDEPPTEGVFPPPDQAPPKKASSPKAAKGQSKNLKPKTTPPDKTIPPTGDVMPDTNPIDKADESDATVASPETWESFRESDLTPSIEDISKGIKIEDIVEPPSEYHYAAFGKPDPFKPVTRRIKQNNALVEAATESVEVPILSTLQLVDLRTVMVLGIWQGAEGMRKAMVTANSPAVRNQSFVVKSGDPIGNRGGVIQSIEFDHIKVNEFEILRDGTRQVNKRELPFYLSVKIPPENLGSWIFNPGTPTPVQKTPPTANGSAGTQGGGGPGATNANGGDAGNGGNGGGARGNDNFLAPGIPQSMFQNPTIFRGPGVPTQGSAPLGGTSLPSGAQPAIQGGGPPTAPPSAYNPNAGKTPATPPPASPAQPAPNNTTSPPTDDRKIKAF